MANDNLLSFMTYNKMTDGSSEFLTSDKWYVRFDTLPSACYAIDKEVLQFRCKSVTGLGTNLHPHSPLTGLEVRGYELPAQPGMIKQTNQQVGINFYDLEDQSILTFLSDWKFRSYNPINGWSYRAEELRAALTFQRLNSQNVPVREYKMVNAILQDFTFDDPFDSERQLVGGDIQAILLGAVFPVTITTLPS